MSKARYQAELVAQRGSRRIGQLTAGARMTPSFLICGTQRCGTTSMYRTLAQHPAVLPPVLHKGVHYFDIAYGKGPQWYRGHFPLRRTGDRASQRAGSPAMTYESSPYYGWHPLAADRIARDLPGVRLLVLVRDPVERAYSAFTHETARGYETETFERALELEGSRLEGAEASLIADPLSRNHAHQHQAYVARGRYVDQLKRIEAAVGRDRLHVVDSDEFFTDPEPVFDGVLRFLGLPPADGIAFERHNARPRSPMSAELRASLRERYTDDDERLAAWWGSPAQLATVTPEPSPATGDGSSNLEKVARGSGANLVGAMVSTVTNLGLIVALTHQLSRRDAGVFFAATSLFLLLETAAGLGTSTAAVYFLPRLKQEQDVEGVRKVLSLATRLVCGASIVAMEVLLFLPRRFGQAEGKDNLHHGVDLLWILALMLPFATLSDIFQASSRGFSSMRTTVLVEKIARPAVQLAAVTVAAFTHDIVWVALAWSLPYIPAAIVSARDVRTRTSAFLRGPWPWPRQPSSIGGEFARYSFPRALSGVASLALQRLDIVLVDAIKGPTDAALYTAATRFLVVGQFLGQSILLAMQPRVSALLGRRAMADAQQLFRVTTSWLVLLTWPLYVTVAVFPQVFLTLFGRGYAGGGTVVVVLAISMLAATITGQVDVMIAMGGRSWYSLANVSLALTVNVALNLILIPRYGIVGAASAWAAAIVIGNAVALIEVKIILGMHPFGAATLSTATLAVLCFGSPGLLAVAGLGAYWQGGGYAVGAVLYLLWLFRARRQLHLAELAGASAARFGGSASTPPVPANVG